MIYNYSGTSIKRSPTGLSQVGRLIEVDRLIEVLLILAKFCRKLTKVNFFIRGYHEYQTEWKPTLGDVYRLMHEPKNVKDSDAVVREKSSEMELQTSTQTTN